MNLPSFDEPEHGHQQNVTSPKPVYRRTELAEYHLNVPYSINAVSLQKLDIIVPLRRPPPNTATWVIYIHGGAWRDPAITAKSFNQACNYLLEEPQDIPIAGFVSIDYRLSPYFEHPTNPSSLFDPSRNAKHPEHLDDVLHALSFLGTLSPSDGYQDNKGINHNFPDMQLFKQGRYILCGHSCGATLAMQAITSLANRQLPSPLSVLGVEGIYNIPGLLERNTHPAYHAFINGAFGREAEDWRSASPAFASFGHWRGTVALAHSKNDELVEVKQREEMGARLQSQGWIDSTNPTYADRKLLMIDLEGKHDEIWESKELPRAIRLMVEYVNNQRT